MKELKDIVLKKGDIVYVKTPKIFWKYDIAENEDGFTVAYFLTKSPFHQHKLADVAKIERPVKYETIYEAPKQILDKEEKEWLENFLRPFRKRVIFIKKTYDFNYGRNIIIELKDERYPISLPYFEKDEYYKGMELDKEYTLKELGLFED